MGIKKGVLTFSKFGKNSRKTMMRFISETIPETYMHLERRKVEWASITLRQ